MGYLVYEGVYKRCLGSWVYQKPVFLFHDVGRFGIRFSEGSAEPVEDVAGFVGEAATQVAARFSAKSLKRGSAPVWADARSTPILLTPVS